MPLGVGRGQNVWLRDFCHILTLLPPGASVFHQHMSSLRYYMSNFPSQFQYYLIELVWTLGNILNEYLLLLKMPWCPHQFLSSNHTYISHSQHFQLMQPFLYFLCKNNMTLKNVTQSVDQSDHRKLRWTIIMHKLYTIVIGTRSYRHETGRKPRFEEEVDSLSGLQAAKHEKGEEQSHEVLGLR